MTTVLLLALAVVAAAAGYLLGRRRGVEPAAPDIRQAAVPAVESPSEAIDRREVERALADLPLGVVVIRADGSEAYRNGLAERFATGRHGDALVEAALERVVGGALLGLSLEESVEVYGPPARSLLVQASPTYDDGDVSGAVCVIDDVTEARHVDRVRADFVANVSHELRTPVGAMSVLAETMADADDPDVTSRLAARMQREAARLGETIDDLLALSSLESGPVIDPDTIDLQSVLTMAVERTGEAAQQRTVQVEIDNATGGPVLVEGDQGQLVSAVSNLIDNAIKYSDPGGAISVSVSVDVAEPGAAGIGGDEVGSAVIVVSDEGIGIPSRDLDRIFERFYRVDTARSRETGGTGLGLSIVRHAMRNHGGTIDVSSTEGVGSVFTVSLPLSPANERIERPENTGDDLRPADRAEGIDRV